MPSGKHFQYFQERIRSLGGASPSATRVLDIGCGAGDLVTFLREQGYDAWGSEVEPDDFWPGAKTEHAFVTYSRDVRTIPFADTSFDVCIANQVLEHVGDLESIASEACRVLKPGGRMFATFPLKTSVIEQHCLSPMAHWFAPGPVRQAWLFLTCPKTARDERLPELEHATGLRKRLLSSKSWDTYLEECCRYRFPSEIRAITTRHFEEVHTDREAYGSFILGHYLRKLTNVDVPRDRVPRAASTLFCTLANDAWVFRKGLTSTRRAP